MPKDEFDFEDPFQLNGVSVPADEDTTAIMCDCLIEEFMRMGYSAPRIVDLFQSRQHLAMKLVRDKHGDQFIRDRVRAVFLQWGRPVSEPLNPSKS